jgi:hypothetical protein
MTTPELIHDELSERALIGCCLVDQRAIDWACNVAPPGDFYLPAHQTIWRAMVELNKTGADVDTTSVAVELQRIGKLEQAGNFAYLDGLYDTGILHGGHVESIAAKVAKCARRRDVYTGARRAALTANDPAATDEQVDAALCAMRAGWECGGDELPTHTGAEIDRMEWPATPEWLVDGWWESEACGFLAAHEKSSKTILAMALSLSIVNGVPFLGRFAVQQGPVLFVAEEDHVRRVQRRIRKLGNALALDWRRDDLHFAAQAGANIVTGRGRGRVVAAVRRFKPVLLVLDPFRQLTPGIEEKDSGEVAEVLSWAREVQRENKCGVMILDHMRKEGTQGTDQGRVEHQIRGSGAKGAWRDSFISVKRKAEDSPEHRVRALHRDGQPLPTQIVNIVWDDPNKGDLHINSREAEKPVKPLASGEPVKRTPYAPQGDEQQRAF